MFFFQYPAAWLPQSCSRNFTRLCRGTGPLVTCSCVDVCHFRPAKQAAVLLLFFLIFSLFLFLYLSLRPRPGWQRRGQPGRRPERSAWRSWRGNRKRYKSRCTLTFKTKNTRCTSLTSIKDISACCMLVSSKGKHLEDNLIHPMTESPVCWEWCLNTNNTGEGKVIIFVQYYHSQVCNTRRYCMPHATFNYALP